MSHLKVAVRIRPFSERETLKGDSNIVSLENNMITVTNLKVPENNAGDSRKRMRRYTFDYCFPISTTQTEVFEMIETEIKVAIEKRQHSCILAYGQSASGKTHTIMGTLDHPGLSIKLCQNLFKYLEMYCDEEERKVAPMISFLEIYNERVRDLLDSDVRTDSVKTLRVREHPKKGPYVQGLTRRPVNDTETLLKWLQAGSSNRKASATLSNSNSSRSHSVFTLTCFKDVQVHLVDLAGSERTSNDYHNFATLKEGANINKSLVALGNVISTLAEQSSRQRVISPRKRFVPYRDSTLTWLLKDILGGNSNTVVIATISPANSCYCETINTLRFGQRAKKIITRPVVNEDPKDRTIRELRAEISRLKQILFVQDSVSTLLPDSVASPQLELNTKNSGAIELESQNSHQKQLLAQTDKLLPVLNVTSSVAVPKFVALMERKKAAARPFGSQETISNVSTNRLSKRLSQPSLMVHKVTLDKLHTTPKKLVNRKTQDDLLNKTEKSVLTEENGHFVKKHPSRTRSQIVAAVTNRLYARTKTKEVAVETSTKHEAVEATPELAICSNARTRLQELTRRALRAHRHKNVETQTDLFPVLRVKEVSTDVLDLKLIVEECRDVETCTETVSMRDVGTKCLLENFNAHLNDLKKSLVVTRSCGTQSQDTEKLREQHPSSTISFTKYLQDKSKPTFEIINPCATNPIYTSSVNINVSHNYISHKPKLDTAVSADSLEDQAETFNVPFSTPDIISNHNSLELGANSNTQSPLLEKRAQCTTTTDPFLCSDIVYCSLPPLCFATLSISYNQCEKRLKNVDQETVYAAQICVVNKKQERCVPIWTCSQDHWPTVSRQLSVLFIAVSQEPVVFKSVIKRSARNRFEPCSCKTTERPITNQVDNSQMFTAMSKFMDEANKLMANLSLVASKFQSEQSYDLEVTLNHLSMPDHFDYDSDVPSRTNAKPAVTVTSNTHIPLNKYDKIVRDSCQRLERCINKSSNQPSPKTFVSDQVWSHDTMQFADEYPSLESCKSHSDYGSLPRQSHINPSEYLKQLRSLRKRVIESSRTNFLNDPKIEL